MNKSYFHIGYPKCGSTTLQKQLFNLHSEINFLGIYPTRNTGIDSQLSDNKNPYFTHPDLRKLHDNLVMYEEFDAKLNSQLLNQSCIETNAQGKINLLSNERVTSVFFSYPKIEEKLNRIRQIGCLGVILIVRNQLDIIKSQYREHPFDPVDLVHGKPMSIDEWIMKADEITPSYLDSLCFDQLASQCELIFGKQNTLILPLNDLLACPEKIGETLSSFLTINSKETIQLVSNLSTENRGVSQSYNTIRNIKKILIGEFPITNYFPARINNRVKCFIKKGKKADYMLKKETLQYLINKFESGNQKIHAKYDIDLGSFS